MITKLCGVSVSFDNRLIAATPPPAPVWLLGTAKLPEVVNGYAWELYNIAEDYSENMPVSDAPSLLNKSYTITAEVEVPGAGAEGMIATLGGRFGGYGLYLLKGKPVFTYNALDLVRFKWQGTEALSPGKHTIVFDFKYDGPGFGKGAP